MRLRYQDLYFLLKNNIYVLLTYVRPNVELSSSTNHLCVTANRSDSVYLVIGVATSFAALSLLGTVVIIIVVVLGIRRKKHCLLIEQEEKTILRDHLGAELQDMQKNLPLKVSSAATTITIAIRGA